MGHATCLACRTQQTGPAVHGDSGGGLPGVLHKALWTRESHPPPITRRVPHRIQARVHPAHLLFGCSVGEGCRCRDRSCLTDAWHDVGGVANILEGVDSVENYLEAA